ncbi:hemolysin family protein [Synechococcus sp. CS-1332]|uniref:hemolysin family protein n=1 Tax=Synechococcus sp. CS-1332 TaxID=2847972 RepID=UPI00223AFEC7|nr:hemolysin family protein [Synechococcus sp. CS-1332]MCT0208055.1 hemolysin family protein [Synechococcus sp. CS-1332]
MLFDGVLIVLLILINGIFSGSELAMMSARRLRLEHQAEAGDPKAEVALKLIRSPNDFLSTVQIGITLIGILSGALGGSRLAESLRPLLEAVPPLRPWAEPLALGIVVTLITFLSLVLGELVPKRIALSDPERFACLVAPPMRTLSRWMAPLAHLLGSSTDRLLSLMGIGENGEPEITEDEIRTLLRRGTESGLFDVAEHAMVERVFRLADRPVKAIMTPRTEICWLDLSESSQSHLDLVIRANHSLYPVARDSLDACVGVVRGRTFLAAQLTDGPREIESFLHTPLYVGESTRALKLIEQFRTSGVHIALVTDEFGGIEGLVTLNDMMEAIVGDLSSARDKEDPMIIVRQDGSWLLDGALDIADFKDLVMKASLPEEISGGYQTLGGFVMHFLEHIPQAGEGFDWEDLRIEVVDMDGNRVDKLLVNRIEAPSDKSETLA